MQVLRRSDDPEGRFTKTLIGYGPEAEGPCRELTANWDQEASYGKGNGRGHICIETPDVYKACEGLAEAGVNITRPAGSMKTARGSLRITKILMVTRSS